jgi:hypothetical protein
MGVGDKGMNKSILVSVLAACALSAVPAMSQQVAPAAKSPQAQQKAPDVAEFDKQAALIQENIRKMQQQMTQLGQIQDPKARQKLLQEHFATMQSGMSMMSGMWGTGMMGHMMGGGMMGGGMMGWGSMSGYYQNLTPEQQKQRQYMMDQYLSMQQMMMSHMMMHQNYMWTQPPAPAK